MGVVVRPFNVSIRRKTPVLVLTTCLLFLLFLGAFQFSESGLPYALPFGLGAALPKKLRDPRPCRSDLNHLRRSSYELTKQILYQKRCIRGLRTAETPRHVMSHDAQPLIQPSSNRTLDLNHACHGAAPVNEPCDPITVQVPLPYPSRDYSEFIFGVASSSARLIDSIPHFKHWLGNTKARLLAIVTDQNLSHKEMKQLAAQYSQAGIRFIGTRPADAAVGANEQHFVIVRDLAKHADASTKWAVIIDDDTFFPSLYPVAQLLDKQDASVPAYIGGLSENGQAVRTYGHMAFGGGGIFLSLPLLKLVKPHVDTCFDESKSRHGDGMLSYCIEKKTGTEFTQMQGLHQLDLGGDLSGFYESGILPLSLHHWKTWHSAPVDKIAQITAFCGSCMLQRWRFGRDTVLSNGYSIAVYRNGTDALPLHRMEATWDGGGPDWEWSLGPVRDKMASDEKKTYQLLDAEIVGNNLRQLYVHRAREPNDGASEAHVPMDEVIELWWDWK